MTKVRNCVLDALSINVNNIISLVVGTFPLGPDSVKNGCHPNHFNSNITG